MCICMVWQHIIRLHNRAMCVSTVTLTGFLINDQFYLQTHFIIPFTCKHTNIHTSITHTVCSSGMKEVDKECLLL